MHFLKTCYPRLVTLAFSPDGKEIALLSAKNEQRALEVWNPRTMTSSVLTRFAQADDVEEPDQEADEKASEALLHWSFDEDYLAQADDVEEPDQKADEKVPEALLRWSSDGTYLALARHDGAIDVWFPYGTNPEHLLSFSLEESCHTLAWGNIHPHLAVGGPTRICYWASPYSPLPLRLSLPFIYEKGLVQPLHTTSLAFSPDDSSFVRGEGGGELLWWKINQRYTPPTCDECTQAPRSLPVTNLWFAPDGMRLLVEQRNESKSQESPSWTKSMLFQQTDNWLSFGSVEQDLLGWSPNSQRIVGTRQEQNSTMLWLEQLDAGTGACLARRPIDLSGKELQTMALVKNETQVVWCVKDPGSRVFNLEIDTLPF